MRQLRRNYEVIKMTKGKPKKDGSGKGTRANKGRGGCEVPKQMKGKGARVAKP